MERAGAIRKDGKSTIDQFTQPKQRYTAQLERVIAQHNDAMTTANTYKRERNQLQQDKKQWEATRDELQRIIHGNAKKLAHAERLAEALRKIAEREWQGEEKSWRTEAIEMQDEAREALAACEGAQK